MPEGFLPINAKDLRERGWDTPDFLFICGDAYVDHPSFGHAVISRLLEDEGYRVGMICQPDWRTDKDFKKLGRPRLGVLVTSGVLDSMINNYTAAKRRRREDAYSPGGKPGRRPDRALIVYCNKIREAFGDIPIIIGGLEASLRRFAHYDYWQDAVRSSILIDTNADLLVFGNGENAILEIARLLDKGVPVRSLKSVRGTAFAGSYEELPAKLRQELERKRKEDTARSSGGSTAAKETAALENGEMADTTNVKKLREKVILLPSKEQVIANKKDYAKAFMVQYREQNASFGHILVQADGTRYVVQNRPADPMTEAELDRVYSLPYMRRWHPAYDKEGGIPAINEVEFSITSHRGCYGGCSFCAIGFHQGRVIQPRSKKSILEEARILVEQPHFKGYIHDVGGPTANFRRPACKKQGVEGACQGKECLYPAPCKNLETNHDEYVNLLREISAIPKVKKVFVRSGVRFDYAMQDKKGKFLEELCKNHISGQLKVAPEHVSNKVLRYMGKPSHEVYEGFVKRYEQINERLGKNQFLVPYFISGHPGSTLDDAIELALYIKRLGYTPEQVQQFIPVPGTLSTCMYYTGLDPRDMKPLYVARTEKEQELQRALLQYSLPKNRELVEEALRKAGRSDLIGYDRDCLIAPSRRDSGREMGGRPPAHGSRGSVARTANQKDNRGGSSGRGSSSVTGRKSRQHAQEGASLSRDGGRANGGDSRRSSRSQSGRPSQQGRTKAYSKSRRKG
ncbi:MAG: YgiQ family radical SAM protein [Clostridia bacterium]|nr:YgiQ family radical SAM protein [Clostridia bacterium]